MNELLTVGTATCRHIVVDVDVVGEHSGGGAVCGRVGTRT